MTDGPIVRRRKRGGLTLIEVVFSIALLAVLIAGVLGSMSTNQRATSDNHEHVVCMNIAKERLEALVAMDWQTGLLVYYNEYLLTVTTPPLFGSLQEPIGFTRASSQTIAGSATTGWLFLTVREPTVAEAPAYNSGNGPIRTTNWVGFGAVPVGAAVMPSGGGPSLLIITVEIRIPAHEGHPGTNFRLQAWRNFTS